MTPDAHFSAIPPVYYAIFAIYEPFLTFASLIGTLADPETTYNQQAPWPYSPPPSLSLAANVTVTQLAHVCALMGLLNVFILSALRKHLHQYPAMQERIATALLTPLLIGDITHLVLTFYALGEERWHFDQWTSTLWLTLILGLTLLVPRVAWHLGIGRYVDKRDGKII